MQDIPDWVEQTVGWLIPLALLAGLIGFACKRATKDENISRYLDEQAKRKEEGEKRWSEYNETREYIGKAVKRCLLEEIQEISDGKRLRISPHGLRAAAALASREGHPDLAKAWAHLLEELGNDITNPQELHERINDLLYPETLEDVDALKRLVIQSVERATHGQKLSEEVFAANESLRRIRERDARKRQEERETKVEENRLEKERRAQYQSAMEEMTNSSLRNITRLLELPEDSFEGIPLDEVVKHIRVLREMPLEERQSYISTLRDVH